MLFYNTLPLFLSLPLARSLRAQHIVLLECGAFIVGLGTTARISIFPYLFSLRQSITNSNKCELCQADSKMKKNARNGISSVRFSFTRRTTFRGSMRDYICLISMANGEYSSRTHWPQSIRMCFAFELCGTTIGEHWTQLEMMLQQKSLRRKV